MRLPALLSCILGSLIFAGICHAELPATQPTTGDVCLLPFTAIGGDNHLDWAGKAVQQNLLTDLGRSKLHPIAADKSTDDRSAAASVGAKYLITGTYQNADQQIRFNGQIIEVSTGNVIGGISATGADRDLFSMEDALSAQAIQQLTQLPGLAGNPGNAIANKPPGPVPPALQPAAIQLVVQPPAAAQGSSYNGSALQSYVETNRTPSTDFNQQVQDADYRSTYGYPDSYTTLYGTYYGGYGFGLFYSVGVPGVPFTGFGYGPSGYFHHGFAGRGGHDHR